MIRCRYLRDEDRSNASQCTSAQSSDHTRNQDEVQALSSALERSSDKREDGAEEDTVDSADSICNPAADKAADDGTKVVLERR